MSILIRDMEMPKSCYDCELIDIIKTCPHYEIPTEAYCQIPWIRKRRDEKCPIVEVPPHGRLIDADELLKPKNQHLDVFADEWYVTVRTIETAPTILEAEEGE